MSRKMVFSRARSSGHPQDGRLARCRSLTARLLAGTWSLAIVAAVLAATSAPNTVGAPAPGSAPPAPSVLLASQAAPQGYWLTAADGGIFNYGSAAFLGSAGSLHLSRPVVAMAPTPDGGGYWLVASDGGIFNYGDAKFYGSAGAIHLNQPIVGMAATPDGGGYWLVASDGGIFNYGDAKFYGSAGAIHLNRPIVGMAATPDGGGYWLVASDGGIFNYGDAKFYGSAGAIHLNRPIVGMAPGAGGAGYWLVATDGGIFNYGSAGFDGSAGAIILNSPIVAMAPTQDAAGYWLVASDGGIFNYGDAKFYGSAGSVHLNSPIVGAAAAATANPVVVPPPPGQGPPTVTGVQPSAGSVSGGTSVTVAGTNLAGVTAVEFGSTPGTVTFDSSGGIIATSPAEPAGTVDITVITPDGTSPKTSVDRYTFSPDAPVVSGISPTSGVTTGGTSVTIQGNSLSGATKASFGNTAGTITSDSPTQIVVTSPAGPSGTVSATVHITVTTPAGTSSSGTADQFTYKMPPVVTSVNLYPAAPVGTPASAAGGTDVLITGSNFQQIQNATAVNFGSTAVTASCGPPPLPDPGPSACFTIESDTQIFAVSPAGSGTVDVTVTNDGGPSATSAKDKFVYSSSAAPTVSEGPTGFDNVNTPGLGASLNVGLSGLQKGDLIAMEVEEKYGYLTPTSTSFSANTPTDDNGTTFHRAGLHQYADNNHGDDLFYGTYTGSSGSDSITVNLTSNDGNAQDSMSAASLDVEAFHSAKGASTTWTLDTTGTNTGGGDSWPYPDLIPSAAGEVYFGYMAEGLQGSGGTQGCVFQTDDRSNQIVGCRSISSEITPQQVNALGSEFSFALLARPS
jgi:hypothetical protein